MTETDHLDASLRLDAALASAGSVLALGDLHLERMTRLTSRVTVLVDQVGAQLAPLVGVPWPTRLQALDRKNVAMQEHRHHTFNAALKARVRPLVMNALRAATADGTWARKQVYRYDDPRPSVRRLQTSECHCGCSATFALMNALAGDAAGHLCDVVFELVLRPAP